MENTVEIVMVTTVVPNELIVPEVNVLLVEPIRLTQCVGHNVTRLADRTDISEEEKEAIRNRS